MDRYRSRVFVVLALLWAMFAVLGPLWAVNAYALQAVADVANPVTDSPLDLNAQIGLWLTILGFMSTVAISFLNRMLPGVEPQDDMKRGVVAFVFCLAVGFLDTFFRGTLNVANFTASFLIVFSTAVGFYTQWFKNSQFAKAIEGKAAGG